jgi:hypothetical protein
LILTSTFYKNKTGGQNIKSQTEQPSQSQKEYFHLENDRSLHNFNSGERFEAVPDPKNKKQKWTTSLLKYRTDFSFTISQT